jgi:hypothetical protein
MNSMATASSIQNTSASCARLCGQGFALRYARRQPSAKRHPATAAAAPTDSGAKPSPSRIQWRARKGVSGERPSSSPTITTTMRPLQNSTAGPRRGPPASSTQRSPGRSTVTLAFTERAPRSTTGVWKTTPRPRGRGR